MKRTIAWSLALLMTIALALGATTAVAQGSSTDLCGLPLRGAIGGLQATSTPNYSIYGGYGGSSSYPYGPGGYGDGGPSYTPTPLPTATPLPQPQEQVNKTCEFGKVQIAVTTDRHGTYRIGDVITVDIYIVTSPEVQINVDNLVRDNMLVFGDSDFELVGAPTIEKEKFINDSHKLLHIQIKVRSFSTEQILWVSADMLYATEAVDNVPAWKRLTTPPLQITTTRTLDHSETPLEGEVQQKVSAGTWLANVLIALGSLVILLAVLLFSIPLLKQWINRPRRFTPAEITWKRFEEVLSRGRQNGFSRKDYALIAAILRGYLDREPATLREIQIVNQGDDRLKDIKSALSKLDRIVFAPQGEELTLNPGELAQLERELERIIPRPVK